MVKKELDNLKYKIYKKSWLSDYITFKQFLENQNVVNTFSELQKRKSQKENKKRVKKDLKNTKK